MKYILFTILAFCLFACDDNHDNINTDGTRYEITFDLKWSASNFPTDYPSNAHFSHIIGFSHEPDIEYLSLNSLATDGIQDMAETGSTEKMCHELNGLIAKDEVHYRNVGNGLSDGTGSISVEVLVENKHSSVSAATMVAPSPDWYVAIIGVDLMEDGALVDTKTVYGYVYDAGTDSGITFSSSDSITAPQDSITLFVDSPLGNGEELDAIICEVTISKL